MRSQTSLFLSQSYQDTWEDYQRSLTRENCSHWDYVVLTASNDRQAEGFRAQIAQRRSLGLLPTATEFAVLPDPEGKRVGSGGATLGVLRYIAETTGKTDFAGLRILVIHSGGDSKRVPQYSALGKLFSPVPHELPDGRASTLFDEFMIAMSAVPGRIREGMVLLSGDVLLLFNPLQIDWSGKGAAAISFKEDVHTGKNHGVFLRGEDGNVSRFLHKQILLMAQIIRHKLSSAYTFFNKNDRCTFIRKHHLRIGHVRTSVKPPGAPENVYCQAGKHCQKGGKPDYCRFDFHSSFKMEANLRQPLHRQMKRH